jgi:hypothetical protein
MSPLCCRKARFAAIVVIATFVGLYPFPGVRAHSSYELPNDLVFAAGYCDQDQGRDDTNKLVRVDKQSLSESIFYSNDEVLILTPLSWSPKGNFLAIFRMDRDGTKQICVLGAHGTLLACYAGSLPGYEDVSVYNVPKYPVTWSQDEQYLYFVVDEGAHYDYGTRRLIEVKAASGKKLRTIYQYRSIVDSPLDMAWTLTLDLAVLHLNAQEEAPLLIDLQGRKRAALSNASLNVICPSFSPSKMYLIAIREASSARQSDQLVILDKSGTILTTASFGGFKLSRCPVWSADESYLLFAAENADAPDWLLKYSIAGDTLVESRKADISVPFVLSPDGTHIALGWQTARGSEVRVLYPGDRVGKLGTSFQISTAPIWIPNRTG